jgi:hypothetical protein
MGKDHTKMLWNSLDWVYGTPFSIHGRCANPDGLAPWSVVTDLECPIWSKPPKTALARNGDPKNAIFLCLGIWWWTGFWDTQSDKSFFWLRLCILYTLKCPWTNLDHDDAKPYILWGDAWQTAHSVRDPSLQMDIWQILGGQNSGFHVLFVINLWPNYQTTICPWCLHVCSCLFKGHQLLFLIICHETYLMNLLPISGCRDDFFRMTCVPSPAGCVCGANEADQESIGKGQDREDPVVPGSTMTFRSKKTWKMAHLWMVYLWKMVIFHGYVTNNQMVYVQGGC